MKNLSRILIILAAPFVVALFTYIILRGAFLTAADEKNRSTQIVEIAPGKTFSDITKDLKERGLIRSRWGLDLLARFKKADTKITAGEYELSPAMKPREILAKLASGDIIKRQITIKEGASVWDVGALLEQAGIISAEEFNKAVADPNLLAKAGVSSASFEGYLFPETYQFSRPINAQQIIWRMLEEGEKHWIPAFTDKADVLKMSRHEVLTLASIIEKESGNVEEQPLISSVFHNRLSQGMKLQSDPTVIYGITDFDGNLTKEHLQTPHPYNTYVNFGLPPGPICNPGESSIKAALFPKTSTFLFFVGDNKGTHIFSTTLQEHNEAVQLYQKSKIPGLNAVPPAASPAAPAPASSPVAGK